jgi:hypothetical protein
VQSDLRGEHRSTGCLGRVRGEHELERQAPAGRREPPSAHARSLQRGECVCQRFPRHALLVLVLPPAAKPVVLLGQVGELEVQRECAEYLGLTLERQRPDCRAERPAGRLGPGRASTSGELPNAFLGLEEAAAALLDEDATEDVAEEANVPPQRSVGAWGAHGRSGVPALRRSRAQP